MGDEAILVDVLVHRLLHHFQVRGRLGLHHVETAADGLEAVAEVGEHVDAVVEGAHVVVVGKGLRVGLIGHDSAQDIGIIFIHRGGKAQRGAAGHQAGDHAVFAV